MRINTVPHPTEHTHEAYTKYSIALAEANPDFEKNLSKLVGDRRDGTSTLFALSMIIDAVNNPRVPVVMRDYTPVRSHRSQLECWPDRSHRFKYMSRAIQSFLAGHPELCKVYDKFKFNVKADTLTFVP